MKRALLLLLATASPIAAQTARDPASVPLPAGLELELKLRGAAVIERFGATFDRLGGGSAIPLIGPGSTQTVRAAADRALVFLGHMQYDLNGDGAISRSEFNAHSEIAWGRPLVDNEYAILDREWAEADADGDNMLTMGEIHALAVALYPVPEFGPPGEEGELILGMDLDNDGFVRWREVEAVLRSRMPG
jgi:hypothetical protein